MFLYEITHRYLKNDYQFFGTLKTKHKISGNSNLLIKVKFHKLERGSPLRHFCFHVFHIYLHIFKCDRLLNKIRN